MFPARVPVDARSLPRTLLLLTLLSSSIPVLSYAGEASAVLSGPLDDASDEVEDRAAAEAAFRKAARGMLTNWLREVLGHRVDFAFGENRRFPATSSPGSGSGEGRVRFRVGFSRLAPKVEMHTRLGGSALGLSVSTTRVTLDVSDVRLHRTAIRAGWHRERDTFDVACRVAF